MRETTKGTTRMPFLHESAEPRPDTEVDQAYQAVSTHRGRFFAMQGRSEEPFPLEAWKTIINKGDEQSMARTLALGEWNYMAEALFHAHLKAIKDDENFEELGLNPYIEENVRQFSQIWTWFVDRAVKRAREDGMEMTTEIDQVLTVADNSRKHAKTDEEKEAFKQACANLPATNFRRTRELLLSDESGSVLEKAAKMQCGAWKEEIFRSAATICALPASKGVLETVKTPREVAALVQNPKFSRALADELHRVIVAGIIKRGSRQRYDEAAQILTNAGFEIQHGEAQYLVAYMSPESHVAGEVVRIEAYASNPEIQAALIQSEDVEVLAGVAPLLDPQGWLAIARRISEKIQGAQSARDKEIATRELGHMLRKTSPEKLSGLTSGDVTWLVAHDDERVRGPARNIIVSLPTEIPATQSPARNMARRPRA